ncbi:hypothetical protein CTAYLR_000881 [Chrysophaeum taylorii]|uniref:Ribonucleoside-diphosphate reductase n=1 Tax=Chrysophaeum taylorii TaxID=2483200 RepID=A0AAD7UFA5_9STRA|nr:hypothetical protein CTAYLR_000881 [Chrysophaeum taylorii]
MFVVMWSVAFALRSDGTSLDKMHWALREYDKHFASLQVSAEFSVPFAAPWPKALWGMELGRAVEAARQLEAIARGDERRAEKRSLRDIERRHPALPRLSKTQWGRRLTTLGFDWGDEREHRYLLLVAALQAYRKEYGDLVLPRNYRVPARPPYPRELYDVNLDRAAYCLKFYRECIAGYPARQTQLRSLGFVWERLQPEFNLIVEALVAFERRYGHLNVPVDFWVPKSSDWPECTQGMPLGRRCCQIRSRMDFVAIDAHKSNQLDAMGFQWSIRQHTRALVDEAAAIYHHHHNGAAALTTTTTTRKKKKKKKKKEKKGDAKIPVRFVVPTGDPAWPEHLWGFPLGRKAYDTKRATTTSTNAREQKFAQLVAALETYKLLYNETAVPQKFVVPKDDEAWPSETRGLRLGHRVAEIRSKGYYVTAKSPKNKQAALRRRRLLLDLGVQELCHGLDGRFVDAREVVDKALAGVSEEGSSEEVETLVAESAAYMASRHPDYSKLAARVELDKLRRRQPGGFAETMLKIDVLDPGLRKALSEDAEFREKVESAVHYAFEEGLDYFGFKTLEKSYTLPGERPSYMVMRVALGIHRGWESEGAWEKALETFELMSHRYFIHASPALFHAGTIKPHLASCFLVGSIEDSIEGIYEALAKCALISKAAGGIGLAASDVRAVGSRVRGTGGQASGLVPMLRVFDATARYVDQGGGKRPGAIAVYVEPWHADCFDVLELKKNHGKEERRARDLFYALWIPDLFMRRVERDANWSLMSPDECPGLADVHSAEFEELYERYEREGRARKVVPARKLWRAILDAQIETGTPYMLYKDSCNRKSPQQHLGTIKCSNLCAEIVEFSNATETAVCNLASLVLPSFVRNGEFDLEELKRVTKVVAANLDATIDVAAYPSEEARRSNLRHRPIGIGVQGLADVFLKLRLPFDSPAAADLDRRIFETIYVAALETSCDLAKHHGPHETYEGSPASQGKLQPDLWGVETERPEWPRLRRDIERYGLRNALLVAPMPTASTAQIVGVNECFEPYTSNLYARRVKAGEFVVANKYLVNDLAARGLWDAKMRDDLVHNEGSVANIPRVPDDLKPLYKTAWELRQKTLLDLATNRAPYVDQSQSLNAFIPHPDYDKLSTFHFHGWRAGLKTGMYYLRTKPAANPLRFTLEPPVCLACSG